MNYRAIEWLHKELPILVAKGVITADEMRRIKEYYTPIRQTSRRATLFMVFGLIGATLIGLGIILIVGHNWGQMNRVSRTALSLGLLLLAQLNSGFVIKKKMSSIVWRECSAAFLMLSIGASLAMIGQTYHLADDFSGFIFIWMLLSIPLPYLLKAHTPSLFYLLGSTVWLSSETGLAAQWIWLLSLLFIPYYWRLLQTDRYKNSAVIISWVFTPCLFIWFSIAFAKYIGHTYLLVYAVLFVITFFIGKLWFNAKEASSWQKPFLQIGFLGFTIVSLILTKKSVWDVLLHNYTTPSIAGIFCVLAGLLVILRLCLQANKHCDRTLLAIAVMPFLSTAAYFTGNTIGISWVAVLFNGYFLLICVSMIITAIRLAQQAKLNIGMLLLSILVLMRFFDMDFSFVMRGIVFIMLGAAFFSANVFLARRKSKGEQNENREI